MSLPNSQPGPFARFAENLVFGNRPLILIVFAAGLGIALLLAAKFRRPVPIILGILVATLANHGFAGAVGTLVTTWLGPQVLRWVRSSRTPKVLRYRRIRATSSWRIVWVLWGAIPPVATVWDVP